MRRSRDRSGAVRDKARAGLAVAGLLVGVAAAPSVHAAGMRTATHPGFARLVFDLPTSGAVQASVAGTQLVIKFQDRYGPALDAGALKRLEAYLGDGKLSPDGKTVTFALRKPVAVKAFGNGKSAVVDLMDQAAAPPAAAAPPPPQPAPQQQAAAAPPPALQAPQAASAPPKPAAAAPMVASPSDAPAAKPAADAPLVPVRVGVHPDHVRLVFDWRETVDYTATLVDGKARIQFNQPGRFDEAALRRQTPKAVGTMESLQTSGGAMFAFAAPAEATLRHGRSGKSVVIDVMTKPDATPAAIAPTALATPPATASAPTALAAAAPAPVQTPSPVQTPAPTGAVAKPAAAPVAASAPAAAAVGAAVGALAAVVPDRVDRQNEVKPAAAPILPTQAPGAARPQAGLDVPVQIVAQGKTQAVRMAWQSAPGAAAFVRGKTIYIVFDQAGKLDLATAKKAPGFASLEQIASAEGTMLRAPAPDGTIPTLERDDKGWLLTFRPGGTKRPEVGLPVSIDSAADNARVQIAAAGATGVVNAMDPDLGENLKIVTLADGGRGVDGDRQFAQFKLLSSLQGVVVLPRADSVDVKLSADRVVISGGLEVSAPARGMATSQVYDFARWASASPRFSETRQMLQRQVADADVGNRPAAMFELAQFFLSQDHVPDALGVLTVLAKDAPGVADDPAFKALRGAANVEARKAPAALADLSDPRLDDEPLALQWRGAALALTGDWPAADQAFRRGATSLDKFPPKMRGSLALLSAEAALRTGDQRRSRQMLDALARPDIPADVRAQADLLRAETYLSVGDRRSGMPIVERLIESPERETRAKATRIWIEQQLAAGKMTRGEAIDQYERLRFAWAGDAIEHDSLMRLGELYQDGGDVKAALGRWREAIQYYPEHAMTPAIKKKMSEAFASLYDRAATTGIAPLAALSLYDEFRELTPAGEMGDRMIQNLADRLVAIDLLDRASALLDHQIKHRLAGVEKAKVGLRLAVVQMLDRQPEKAIEALQASEALQAPAELNQERRRLKSEALLQIGDPAGALQALDGDTSRPADELRAEIHRRSRNWSAAALILGKLAGSPNQGDMGPERQATLVNLAIARALSGDGDGLRRLRDDFTSKFPEGQNKQAFQVLTAGAGAVSGVDAASVTNRFAELSAFQSAVSAYREKMRESGLSSIN